MRVTAAPTPSRTAVQKRGGSRLAYLARIATVYGRRSSGPLSFWHETPEANDGVATDPRQYWMRFQHKADYRGPFDSTGIPLLDYRGDIGVQYNPIAIAQYGLARFNRWCVSQRAEDRASWTAVADWLTEHLEPNGRRIYVWMHHFDWQYRNVLNAPWYSGLAQGNGVSMLVRAAEATGSQRFADAAHRASQAFTHDVSDGGVIVTDARGFTWIEEYLVDPPSHILNGFIWASWGVYDYARWSDSAAAHRLWCQCIRTLEHNLHLFDTGWWSLYEAPNVGGRALASFYYHRLHITQLRVLFQLTGVAAFSRMADTFDRYASRRDLRARALAEKAWFKIRRY